MSQAPSQPEGSGLQKLHELVADLKTSDGLKRYKHPIVLVPGFSGFGEPLFGSVNYWGGFQDLAKELQLYTGLPIILPRIGPISSNWERACELYCQLREIQRNGPGTGFDTRQNPSTAPIPVDYGQYIPLPPGPPGPPPTPHLTKKAEVLGPLPPSWQWDRGHPVHMICHSQGGNTVRLLVELLSGRHGQWNTTYFGPALGDRQDFVKSVVTLGTPYLGTTITNVIFNDILANIEVSEVISRLVVSASLNPTRFVDLQLGHWGFTPIPGESFLDMHNRLQPHILAWWNSIYNGLQDNGKPGITTLNTVFNSPQASPNTYYFTMSFDATKPLPKLDLSGQDLRSLPVNLALSSLRLYPGPSNVTANTASFLSSLFHGWFSAFPGNPDDIAYARWAVEVINNHTSALGYDIRIPSPGKRIPREDMLPILSIFSLGMSGVNAPIDPSGKNDGVVDTASMCGPANNQIQDSVGFNTAALTTNRGVYWHFGETEGIDHADQIGVFTNVATYHQVLQMYKDLGDLLSFLP